VSVQPKESLPAPAELPDAFSGDVVLLQGVSPQEAQRLRRLIIAYDGDVCTTMTAKTTHVVVPRDYDRSLLSADQRRYGFQIVDVSWIDEKVRTL
jgi:hypothetical protein